MTASGLYTVLVTRRVRYRVEASSASDAERTALLAMLGDGRAGSRVRVDTEWPLVVEVLDTPPSARVE